MRRDRATRPEAADRFEAASGDWELQIDAGKVNTTEGWRDVKCATFARRDRAEATDSTGYEQRDLPAPSTRAVVAEVEVAEDFGHRCQVEAMRLRRPVSEPMSVLGDGAEWIWTLKGRRFADAEPVLDVFHAVEHLAELTRAAWGTDEVSARQWLDGARRALVADNWAGVCQYVATTTATVADPAALQKAYPAVANYLLSHRDRMSYAARLARGQSIGSGLIEGTIKQRVGRRLKRSGARWVAGHVGPFVEMTALADGPDWDDYWKPPINHQN